LATASAAFLAFVVCSPSSFGQTNTNLLLTPQTSGTTTTLELTPANNAEDVQAWWRRGGFVFAPRAVVFARPFVFYRPFFPVVSLGVVRPVVPVVYATPPAFYYAPPPWFSFYPAGLNVTIASPAAPSILRSGPSGIENLPLPTPVPGQPAPGTYPYDGGPANPVPPAKRENKPPNATMPLEGRTVSVPAPATPKYAYPAYGEERTPKSSPPDRTLLIRK
jgi:hypothetical protein